MNCLLKKVGEFDVEDCGDLTLKVMAQFSHLVDPQRVCVQGISHGGFLTGWLIGHPSYKDIWAAASLWNANLDLTYFITSADIPDWAFATCLDQELDF